MRAHFDTAPEGRNIPERGRVAETSRSGCAWQGAVMRSTPLGIPTLLRLIPRRAGHSRAPGAVSRCAH